MSSISHIVKEIVSSDPSTFQCILNDIVNYTKLSKKLKPLVSEAIGHDVSVDTIKMALIRFAEKIFKEFNILKRDVAQVLAKSSIEIRTGITIVTIRNAAFSRIAQYIPLLSTRSRFLAIMQSILVTTVILDNESSEEIISRLNKDDIMNIQRDYSAIVIVSPIEIMYTPRCTLLYNQHTCTQWHKYSPYRIMLYRHNNSCIKRRSN